jgi:hypothetical protein
MLFLSLLFFSHRQSHLAHSLVVAGDDERDFCADFEPVVLDAVVAYASTRPDKFRLVARWNAQWTSASGHSFQAPYLRIAGKCHGFSIFVKLQRINPSSQLSVTMVSLLRNTTYRPRAR